MQDAKPSFPGIYLKPTAYDGTTTTGTQPGKYMTAVVNVDK